MSDFIKGVLLAFIPSLLVSILTAIVTVKLSIKQFYTQRWWEKKAEAYSNILEQLFYLLYYTKEFLADYTGEKRLSDDYKHKLNEGYFEAKKCVEKAAATGAYIVCENTVMALENLIEESMTKEDDWLLEIENNYKSISKTIKIVRHNARKDLLRL